MPSLSSSPGARWATACAAAIAITLPAAASADTGCPTPAAYSGAGTAGDPFVIATGAHLQRLRDTSADWNDVSVLSADIDMGGCTWTTTIGQANSPAFTGTLDGQGHVVSGLTIALPVTSSTLGAGLIGWLGSPGVVEDIGFTGDVSALATGSSSGVSVGGLVGRADSGSAVRRSFATGAVSATNAGGSSQNNYEANAGGLIGLSAANVAQSWAGGAVTATITSNSLMPARAGGLVGFSYPPGTVTSVLARGAATASRNGSSASGAYAGALAGVSMGTSVTGSFWSSTLWPSPHDGAGIGGPVGTGQPTSGLQSFATYGPSGGAWDITDGYSASTTWSICGTHNGGYPFLSQFATASVCPAPPPDPDPTPSPDSDTGSAAGRSAATAIPTPVSDPVPVQPRRRTTIGVVAQQRHTVPVGRRSTLVDGVRTSGTVTGVGAWCEVRGVRLPRPLQARMCGIRVDRGAASTVRSNATRAIRVTARPTCSTGLVIRVRISARAAGATRTTWARSWRVSSSPPVPCRIAPKYAVTG